MKSYNTVVIGGGPGGYEAAIGLAKAGVETLLIEKSKARLGGTCLNEGCTPAKNYIESAGCALRVSHFRENGLGLEYTGLDLGKLRERTFELVDELRSGVSWLLDQAGVELLYGTALFKDAHTLEVDGETIAFEKCIIATGSQLRQVAQLPIDGERIISSREVFELTKLPASLAIVGGGPIGCEFANFFAAFGVDVTLISRGKRLLSGEDEELSKVLLRAFKKRGIRVITASTVQQAEVSGDGVEVTLEGESRETIACETVLCAAGRTPNTRELSLEKAGVELGPKGFVEVNAAFRTSQPHIYALGDCINTPAYAHTAYAEARIAARNIAAGKTLANTALSPSAIFTHPAVASCGLKESEAQAKGVAVEVRKAYFKANARAKILGDDAGFAKIVVSAESGVILGASVIGAEATEIIHELLLAVEQKMTADELKTMIHAHPTVSEIISFL
ncbi:dihydrolipoyl dehydrogenase [Sulfurimonas sp. HSL3-7]|uniref:dihydrolipoyl dehydrogenase n=1 Tax=Sulfonitrofixus jiaomeiensis TaxID=3131938 RepID=UPI0031F8B62D